MQDGTSLRGVDPRLLHEDVAIVSQEPVLFAGTIASNIRYGVAGAVPHPCLGGKSADEATGEAAGEREAAGKAAQRGPLSRGPSVCLEAGAGAGADVAVCEADVVRAARVANADEFITEMPGGCVVPAKSGKIARGWISFLVSVNVSLSSRTPSWTQEIEIEWTPHTRAHLHVHPTWGAHVF